MTCSSELTVHCKVYKFLKPITPRSSDVHLLRGFCTFPLLLVLGIDGLLLLLHKLGLQRRVEFVSDTQRCKAHYAPSQSQTPHPPSL